MADAGAAHGYSMQEYLAQQIRKPDTDSTSSIVPDTYPDPVIPPVFTNHLIIDLADAKNAESDFVKEWEVAPTQPPSGFIENGTGKVYRAVIRKFWIPTPEDAAVVSQEEYWLHWSSLRTGYYGFPHIGPRPQFPLMQDATDATRTRLSPLAHMYLLNEGIRLEPGVVSISSAAGPITMRRVRYTASCTFDGAGNLEITLGADHGVVTGDVIHPYTHDVTTARSSFAINKPHGSIVTAATATTVVVACAGAATTQTLKVVVGSRWVRIPVTIQSHHSSVTNYVSV